MTASLRVGLVAYRSVLPETVASLWQLQLHAVLDLVRGAEITRARNEIAARTKEDYLLFVDSDMSFPFASVQALLDVLAAEPERGAVSGLYVTWTGSAKPVCGWRNGKSWLSAREVQRRAKKYARKKLVKEVDQFGAGLLAIRKEALEAVGQPVFETRHDPDLGYLSEDTMFCMKLKNAGYQPSVHFGAWAGHIGPTEWTPAVLEGV